jgi:hypothetical protein
MKRERAPLITAVYEERVIPKVDPSTDEAEPKQTFECDMCGKVCDGAPAGSGLMVWFRGDEMRIDEPPLCGDCSTRITMGAMSKWINEGEEEE